MKIRDIVQAIEQVAPPSAAADWDNVGLQAGDPAWEPERIVTCLDATPATVAAAGERALLLAHHPVIFRPLRSLAETSAPGKTLAAAIRARTAIHVAHTNFDVCDHGMGRVVCEQLELEGIQRVRPKPQTGLDKIIVFVPAEHREPLVDAMTAAGAARIGDYVRCSFATPGTGTFQGLEGTNPTIGETGNLERVEELRLEVVCPRHRRMAALAAMLAAHPYEEPAYDVVALTDVTDFHQVTWVGEWPTRVRLREAAECVQSVLCDGAGVRVVGDLHTWVRRIAVATGSAAKQLHGLRDVDLFITGDMDHHAALEAQDAGLAMVAAGHFHTEKWFGAAMTRLLRERLPDLKLPIDAAPETSPFSMGV